MIDELRAACQPWHEKLHVHPLLQGLNAGSLDLTRYRTILRAFHSVYAPLERSRSVAMLDGVPDASALDWLEQDIRQHAAPALPGVNPPQLPKIDTLSKLFGYLYVKQGSTLGGQVISKHLQDALKLEPGKDNRFFYGEGPVTGGNWKRFTAALEAASPQLDAQEVTDTAVAIFRAIDDTCAAALTAEGKAAA